MEAMNRSAVAADLERRVSAVQALMREREVPVLVAVVTGVPGRTGWIRYFAGMEVAVPRAYVLIERGERTPLVVLWSVDEAARAQAAGIAARMESTSHRGVAPLQVVIERIGALAGGTGRVGVLSLRDGLTWGEYQAVRAAYPELELVDMTAEVDHIRQIKAPAEIEAMRALGRVLDQGLDLFAARARPGRSRAQVAAEVEAFFRSCGCVGGRVKYSLGEQPYTIPPLPGQRFAVDDVLVFQFVYLSPLGYWYELSRLFSFKPLAVEARRRLEAMEHAMEQTAKASVPGATYGAIAALADRVFREHGFDVVGKHTEDVHTIGTDIRDGYNITPRDWTLEENMVLAVHPASLLPGGLGFFLCDNFHVRRDGAVPLSPVARRYRSLADE